MKRIVIKDIARLAGVSKSTVSKAINNYGDIPESTKEKIRKIIKEHNFYPHESAQMLGRGKNNTIAFISSRISAYFTSEVLRAIEDRARTAGKYVHDIIPYSTFYDRKVSAELFKKILYGRKAAAVVALAMNPEPGILLEYKKAEIPVILIENRLESAHSVNTDNRGGGFMAAEYLIKKGRKNIGLICGWPIKSSKYGFSYATEERKAGFDEALKQYGIKPSRKYLELTTHYSIPEGIKLFDRFMKNGIKLDAVFCAAGDMTALGVMESAKKYGMRIPGDLAVIGFDDYFYSAYLNPPLTTVRQPINKLGAEVFDMAVEAIEGKPDFFKHIEIEPELIIRQSA
jgi:LacI family transcriptional regulator